MTISLNITISTSLANETPINISPGSQTITKTGIGKFSSTVVVGTGEKTVSTFGELTTEGVCVLRNTSTTAIVRWGYSTGVYGGRIKPSETFCFRLNPTADLFFISDTASTLVDIDVLED